MEKIINNLTIGADPEFILKDRKTGAAISAEGIAKGTKDKPHCFDKKNIWFSTSLDNVLYEGNIPPARTAFQFYRNINKLIKYIESSIPEDIMVDYQATATLDWSYLNTPNARTYGCMPSVNTWTQEEIYVLPDNSNKRSIGSHIHTGYDNPNRKSNLMLGKAMDLFLGIPSVIIEPKNDRRSSGYGTAGSVRFTKFGLEYRVLSGYFTKSKELIEWSFNNTKKAASFVNKGNIILLEGYADMIQETINTGNVEYAKEFIKEFNIDIV